MSNYCPYLLALTYLTERNYIEMLFFTFFVIIGGNLMTSSELLFARK